MREVVETNVSVYLISSSIFSCNDVGMWHKVREQEKIKARGGEGEGRRNYRSLSLPTPP